MIIHQLTCIINSQWTTAGTYNLKGSKIELTISSIISEKTFSFDGWCSIFTFSGKSGWLGLLFKSSIWNFSMTKERKYAWPQVMIKSSCAYSVELFDIINIIFKIPEFKEDHIFFKYALKVCYVVCCWPWTFALHDHSHCCVLWGFAVFPMFLHLWHLLPLGGFCTFSEIKTEISTLIIM